MARRVNKRDAEPTYVERAAAYADAVVTKKIPASKLVILACERFINDLERKDIYLDITDAERWCRFLECLPHVKGIWAAKRQRFRLSDWQIFAVINVYGWKWVKNDLRRFREALIMVPRKNGKSFFLAGLGLGHITIDHEVGAEVYCGATTEKQAWEVFRPAHDIATRFAALRAKYGVTVKARSITAPDEGARFEPVIGNPGDGSSPSCAIVDEFHEHDSSNMVDTFATGMGARRQPIMWMITTAGDDVSSPCYDKYLDVIRILDGAVQDDRVFGLIYGIDEDDDWSTVEAQRKANPNYGISVDPDYLMGQLDQAKRSAVKQAAYNTKHLNRWVGAKQAWMNMLAFQRCRQKKLELAQFVGRRIICAFDLASKIDVAVRCDLVLPAKDDDVYHAFFSYYVPEERVTDPSQEKYMKWHREGWITATPGNVIDFDMIQDDLRELRPSFEIVEVPFDPFQATQFSTQLASEGFPMVEFGQQVKNFSEPMKTVEALILQKRLLFSFDPVIMWMMGNVVAIMDKKDNIFPDKATKANKIDGVVALIMAVGRAIALAGKEDGVVSGYEVISV